MNLRSLRPRDCSVAAAAGRLTVLGLAILLAGPATARALQAEEPATSAQAESPRAPRAKPSIPRDITYESSVGNVVFQHRMHMKMGCGECHHQIHAEPLDTPHEDYLDSSWINCQTCHNASSEMRSKYYECSACHHSETDNIADETLSAKVVIHKSCWKCHETGTGEEASAGCHDCHIKPQQEAGLPAAAETP